MVVGRIRVVMGAGIIRMLMGRIGIMMMLWDVVVVMVRVGIMVMGRFRVMMMRFGCHLWSGGGAGVLFAKSNAGAGHYGQQTKHTDDESLLIVHFDSLINTHKTKNAC